MSGAAPKPSVSSLRREVKATMYATATSDADEARAEVKRIDDLREQLTKSIGSFDSSDASEADTA